MAQYKVDQLVFTGDDVSPYIADITVETEQMQNNIFTPTEGFDSSKIYYMHLKADADPLENHTFNIKLTNTNNDDYQFLKTITINKSNDNMKYIPIIVYGPATNNPLNDVYEYLIQKEFLSETVSALSPTGYFNSPCCDENGDIQPGTGQYEVGFYEDYNENQGYKLFTPGIETAVWIPKNRVNRIISNESWKKSTDSKKDIWLIFKPFQHFDSVTIEYVKGNNNRAPQEFSIVKFAEMKELINTETPSLIPHSPLVHLGVWAQNNFLLSVNGEEIAIGPRQYYEVENLNITSLAVYPRERSDNPDAILNFTIDYQYIEEQTMEQED